TPSPARRDRLSFITTTWLTWTSKSASSLRNSRNDERLFPEPQFLEFRNELADLLVQVSHVVVIKLNLSRRAGLGVGRAENRPVHEVRRKIKIKRLVLVL